MVFVINFYGFKLFEFWDEVELGYDSIFIFRIVLLLKNLRNYLSVIILFLF